MVYNLEENLELFLEEVDQEKQRGFRIENLDQAEWAMRKIRRAAQRINDIDELVRRKVEQLEAWADREKRHEQGTIDSMQGLLYPFVLQETAGKRRKSISLPSGVAGFRSKAVKYEYDVGELLDWIRNHDNRFLEIKEVVVWGDLKKSLQVTHEGSVIVSDTGEVIGCIRAQDDGDSFYTKPHVDKKIEP